MLNAVLRSVFKTDDPMEIVIKVLTPDQPISAHDAGVLSKALKLFKQPIIGDIAWSQVAEQVQKKELESVLLPYLTNQKLMKHLGVDTVPKGFADSKTAIMTIVESAIDRSPKPDVGFVTECPSCRFSFHINPHGN